MNRFVEPYIWLAEALSNDLDSSTIDDCLLQGDPALQVATIQADDLKYVMSCLRPNEIRLVFAIASEGNHATT